MRHSFAFDVGRAAGAYVAVSARLQAANAGRWQVTAEIAGRTVGRVCANWAGAKLALSLLKKRGGHFLSYQRIL